MKNVDLFTLIYEKYLFIPFFFIADSLFEKVITIKIEDLIFCVTLHLTVEASLA